MHITKTLAWFFLLPISFFYTFLKGTILKFILALYRIWRFLKNRLLTDFQLYLSPSNLTSLPLFIFTLTALIVIFNLSSWHRFREFNSQTLLERLFNEVEELTVIDTASAQVINPDSQESPITQLAALEIPKAEIQESTSTELKIIRPIADESGALIRPNIASSETQNRSQIITYQVLPGDNISIIAEKYGLSAYTVLWANHLSAYSIIQPGEELKILPVNGVIHKVKSGDTLLKIAQAYDIDIEKIAKVNDLVSANQLQINQNLIIPGGKPPAVKRRTTRLASFEKIFSSSSNQVSSSGFIWPTISRRITQYYWLRHKALDIGGSSSDTIVASKAGRVEFAGWASGYGYNVVLNHGSGVKTRYAHMRLLFVKVGEQVGQGEALGKKGSTGRSTGVHLHFEIIINGQAVNPLSYL